MPSVNMIAARRAEKHRLEQRTRNLVYGILAEAGLFLVALSFMVVQLVTTQGQAGDLNDKIAKLKPQVDQIQALQQQTAQLQPKLTALTSARNNTLYWYTSIENLTSCLSGSSWLVSLSTTGDPSAVPAAGPGANAAAAGAAMQFSGVSLNQSDVGLTMLRMNQYPQFDRVNLSFVQQQQQQNQTSQTAPAMTPVEFQIAVQLHSTASAKPVAGTLGNDNVQKS